MAYLQRQKMVRFLWGEILISTFLKQFNVEDSKNMRTFHGHFHFTHFWSRPTVHCIVQCECLHEYRKNGEVFFCHGGRLQMLGLTKMYLVGSSANVFSKLRVCSNFFRQIAGRVAILMTINHL